MLQLQHPGEEIETGTGGIRSETVRGEMLEVMREHVKKPTDHWSSMAEWRMRGHHIQ